MTKEVQFKKWLITRLSGEGVHIQRFEDRFHPGIPDMNVCFDGQEIWIECKVYPNKLSPAQRIWHGKRIKSGGTCCTMTLKGTHVVISVLDRHITTVERIEISLSLTLHVQGLGMEKT
jgi:hypothetical protein